MEFRRRVLVVFAGFAGCLSASWIGDGFVLESQSAADTIFVGENIVTMDASGREVEAVAVRGSLIAAVGRLDEVMTLEGDQTKIIDLGDRALLPGFIDAHGHLLMLGQGLDSLSLHSPPVGDVENIEDIVRKTRSWIEDRGIAAGEMVLGVGYDDSLLAENRHPTRSDLDRASTEHRIVLTHVSGHLRTANSAALEASGISADTADPAGGHIRRREGSGEPNGVLEERAGGLIREGRRMPVTEEIGTVARRALEVYASYGTTTVQDGYSSFEVADALRQASEKEPFPVDVAVFTGFRTIEDADRARYEDDYSGGFRIAGVKFSLDGSPQGRTAWLTEPYTEGPPGAQKDYRAYWTLEPELYRAGAATLLRRGIPIIVHANGDAAIDLMLDGVEEALLKLETRPDHRAVIIHAQLMRADQVVRASELQVIPSFFSAHSFFWGDWHRRSFGDARAENISPVRWAVDHGVRFTVHNDSPIVPPDIMRLVSITVNRTTRSGVVLGAHQRATVEEALHAVTLGAAYQYFEDDMKGSITTGKQADLVILDANPLTSAIEHLADIRVLETYSRGRSVFVAPQK